MDGKCPDAHSFYSYGDIESCETLSASNDDPLNVYDDLSDVEWRNEHLLTNLNNLKFEEDEYTEHEYDDEGDDNDDDEYVEDVENIEDDEDDEDDDSNENEEVVEGDGYGDEGKHCLDRVRISPDILYHEVSRVGSNLDPFINAVHRGPPNNEDDDSSDSDFNPDDYEEDSDPEQNDEPEKQKGLHQDLGADDDHVLIDCDVGGEAVSGENDSNAMDAIEMNGVSAEADFNPMSPRQQSFTPSMSSRISEQRRKILLLFDLDGTCCFRATKPIENAPYDFFLTGSYIYTRPNISDFISNIKGTGMFDPFVCTSIMTPLAVKIVMAILPAHPEMKHKLLGRDTTKTDRNSVVHLATPTDLYAIWHQFPEYNEKNTIVLDDDPRKFLEHPYNGIVVPRFKEPEVIEQNTLFNFVQKYLVELGAANPLDVREYIRARPFQVIPHPHPAQVGQSSRSNEYSAQSLATALRHMKM